MRLFAGRNQTTEHLVWSRDVRFIHALAGRVPTGCQIELETGSCLVAPSHELTDAVAGEIARLHRDAEYGLVPVDRALPPSHRYVVALSAAVQASGIADRIGMAQTAQAIQTRTLDYFFSLRNNHEIQFQPIVTLATGEIEEFECLFRPVMPMLPQTVASIVQAAIDTNRTVELDSLLVRIILERVRAVLAAPAPDDAGSAPAALRVAINFTPASLLDPRFEANAIADLVAEYGLAPGQVIVECTEQQAVADVALLQRQVKALRRLGFGFAVDDAGAGYASFALIAALRPSIIKIDREIVDGIRMDDAKQALVEAFVSFSRRIGANLVAEGIETRSDLATLVDLGVDSGQGYLIGKPESEPVVPHRGQVLRLAPAGVRPAAARTWRQPPQALAARD